MFARTLKELAGTPRQKVLCEGKTVATRMLAKGDGLGFSLSDVRLAPGMDFTLWYKHHWEANYIVAGAGTVSDLDDGRTWRLEPGLLYVAGPRDRHRMVASADCHIVSVFCPAIEGEEEHDADGSYPPTGPVPAGQPKMFAKTVTDLADSGLLLSAAAGSATTLRMLTQADDVGITLSDVHMAAGNSNTLWYKHHWEANVVLAGRGRVEDLTTGQSWAMEPGMMYCVGPNDRHAMHAEEDLHLISVFNPPLRGDEIHDGEGTLAASGPIPPGPKGG